jgi:hypothetical protein
MQETFTSSSPKTTALVTVRLLFDRRGGRPCGCLVASIPSGRRRNYSSRRARTVSGVLEMTLDGTHVAVDAAATVSKPSERGNSARVRTFESLINRMRAGVSVCVCASACVSASQWWIVDCVGQTDGRTIGPMERLDDGSKEPCKTADVRAGLGR